jgi:hypothetical protein
MLRGTILRRAEPSVSVGPHLSCDPHVEFLSLFVFVFVFVFCVGPAVTHRMYCSLPRLIVLTPLNFPPSSPEALHIRRRERPLLARGRTMREKCPTIANSTAIVGFFYMPQSCDMGPTALLPLRRKAC